MKNSFCKLAHIRKRSDFLRIQKQGSRQHQKYLMVVFLANVGQNARLGIVATTKIGNAVVRNRAKRLVREAFRRNQEKFSSRFDFVVILLKGINKATQAEIDLQMISAVRKIK